MNHPLFSGTNVYLAAPQIEHDAQTLSHWTHDAEFMRLMHAKPARPLSPAEIKKAYQPDKQGNDQFEFMIRAGSDERLLGYVRLYGIGWAFGNARLQIGIGNPRERRKGYGGEALALCVTYAFDELNLNRLTAVTGSYNQGAIRFLEKAGFKIEVRQRKALNRAGERWDAMWLGLLAEEWNTTAG